MLIHAVCAYTDPAYPGYLTVLSSGGDASGYSFLWQITNSCEIQVKCNIDNGRSMRLVRIGGMLN